MTVPFERELGWEGALAVWGLPAAIALALTLMVLRAPDPKRAAECPAWRRRSATRSPRSDRLRSARSTTIG